MTVSEQSTTPVNQYTSPAYTPQNQDLVTQNGQSTAIFVNEAPAYMAPGQIQNGNTHSSSYTTNQSNGFSQMGSANNNIQIPVPYVAPRAIKSCRVIACWCFLIFMIILSILGLTGKFDKYSKLRSYAT